MYCPAGQDETAAARPVSAVTVQTLVTYCVLFGAEQGVQEPALFTASVYVLPATQLPQMPLLPPPALAVPAT